MLKGGSMRFEIEHKYDTEIMFICLTLIISLHSPNGHFGVL